VAVKRTAKNRNAVSELRGTLVSRETVNSNVTVLSRVTKVRAETRAIPAPTRDAKIPAAPDRTTVRLASRVARKGGRSARSGSAPFFFLCSPPYEPETTPHAMGLPELPDGSVR
jgi:hypothetical protein